MADIDIHDYASWIEKATKRLERVKIPEENKKLILEFDRACLIERLSIPRRAKLMRHLIDLAREFLPVPFATATRRDIQDAVAIIEARKGYSPWTKQDVKIAMRKFFKWLAFKDDVASHEEYPDTVAWIRPWLKKKDMCRVQAADLLSAEEVERIIQGAQNPRNRAMLALIYELGARIGEVGSLTVGRVSRDEYSLLVDLDGKTGKRSVRIVLYASHLVAWLNLHPGRNDPACPLWPSLRKKTYLQPLPYHEFSIIIKKAAKEAGIQKRIYPHLFRHSRATHLLASGKLNEAQAKVFFGWVPDSKVLSTYAHLVTKDANDAILRMYGVQKEQSQVPVNMLCGMCGAPNPAASALCYRCGYALSANHIEDVQERKQQAEEQLLRFLERPEVKELFKKMIREQSSANNDKGGELHQQAARPSLPSEEANSLRRRRGVA